MLKYWPLVIFILILSYLSRVRDNYRRMTLEPLEFRDRDSQLHIWQEKYPSKTDSDFIQFLTTFVESFFGDTEYLHLFSPDDISMRIYLSKYSIWDLSDDMEYEEWIMRLENEYNIEIEEEWENEITLGEIFELVTSQQSF